MPSYVCHWNAAHGTIDQIPLESLDLATAKIECGARAAEYAPTGTKIWITQSGSNEWKGAVPKPASCINNDYKEVTIGNGIIVVLQKHSGSGDEIAYVCRNGVELARSDNLCMKKENLNRDHDIKFVKKNGIWLISIRGGDNNDICGAFAVDGFNACYSGNKEFKHDTQISFGDDYIKFTRKGYWLKLHFRGFNRGWKWV